MRIDEYQRIYEGKHDDELLMLVESAAELTDEARAALQSELERRGLRAEVTLRPVPAAIEQDLSRSVQFQFPTVGEFLNAVMSTYRSHFWLFVGLTAPAIVFGFYGREFSRMFARHVVEQFLARHTGELIRPNIVQEATVVGGIVNFLIWICFCVCYAGVVTAVNRINQGDAPLFRLDGVFERPGRFLGVSIILGVSFVAMTGCCLLIYFWLQRMFPALFEGTAGQIVLYGFSFLVMLVLSRFALSIPAVTLGNCTVRQSMFRSDEITEGKWGFLAAVLIKSIVGGYVAAMLPFWIAGWMWPYVHFYTWFLTAASIAGVILVEPILFIGFSLLYVNGMDAVRESDREIAVQV